MSSHHEREYYSLEKVRCLNIAEIKRLRKVLKRRLYARTQYYGQSAIKQWFLVELGLSTGLRISEICNLRMKHIFLYSVRPFVFVEQGKGGKSRRVEIDFEFRETVKSYMIMKKEINESVKLDDYLLHSSRSNGRYSTRGLQFMFAKCLEIAKISQEFSVHCMRHTFALAVYKATKFNIRYVQKQLGHSSLRVTEIYLQALMSELQKPLKRLY